MGYNARPPLSSSNSGNGARPQANDAQQKGDQDVVRDLDRRMREMQSNFQDALNLAAAKETEKFDLILSILGELQSRQADLEESFKGLTTQLAMNNDNCQTGQTAPMSGTMQMAGVFQPQAQQVAMMANGNGVQQQQGTMMMNGDMTQGYTQQQMVPTQMVAQQQPMTPKGAFPVMLPNGQLQYVQMQQVPQMQNVQQMQYMDTSTAGQQDQSQHGMAQ